MSGRTSTASKNAFNKKTYDQLPIRVAKGEKDKIADYAKEKGYTLNGYVIKLITDDMNNSK